MKRCISSLGSMIMLLALSAPMACADQPQGKKLSSTEIKQNIIGKTTRYTKGGAWIVAYWGENGTVHAINNRAKRRDASGTWKITDDGQLCSSWYGGVQWGDNGCKTLYLDEKTGQISKYNSEGSLVETIMEILPGNPEKIF